MTEDKPVLKPCPFCGVSVHWDDEYGILHDRLEFNCIVDWMQPMESNMNLSREMWIKHWNFRKAPERATSTDPRVLDILERLYSRTLDSDNGQNEYVEALLRQLRRETE